MLKICKESKYIIYITIKQINEKKKKYLKITNILKCVWKCINIQRYIYSNMKT